jgi:hypothetical protein
MAELFTPDYGFVKPQPGTGEPAAIEKINSNFDKVEKWGRVIWVNDGVTPSTADLIEGATVAEITSRKVWIAKKNLGGTFDRKWVEYPWALSAYTDPLTVSSGAWANVGFVTYATGQGINSSVADLVGTRMVAPINGWYDATLHIKWPGGASGVRGCNFNINATAANEDINTGNHVAPLAGAAVYTHSNLSKLLNAGDTLSANVFQNSGGSVNCTLIFTCVLTQVVG